MPLNGMRIKSGQVAGFDSLPWYNSNNVNLRDMDMNKISLNVLVIVAVIIAICLAGRVDYNDAVLYNMDSRTYEVLKEKMGDVSRSELADAYQSNKEYWDSLGQLK